MSALPPAPFPTPTSLRLVSKAASPRTSPPLGVAKWSNDDAADVAVVLAPVSGTGALTLEEAAAQLPAPEGLRSGALIIVLPTIEDGRGLLGRWLGGKTNATTPLRCGALLLAGYERICGGADARAGELVWGYAPVR